MSAAELKTLTAQVTELMELRRMSEELDAEIETLQDAVKYAVEIPLGSVTITHKTRTFVLIDEKNSDFSEFSC